MGYGTCCTYLISFISLVRLVVLQIIILVRRLNDDIFLNFFLFNELFNKGLLQLLLNANLLMNLPNELIPPIISSIPLQPGPILPLIHIITKLMIIVYSGRTIKIQLILQIVIFFRNQTPR